MKNFITIDQTKVVEWGLNYTEAILFAWMYSLPSWAQQTNFEGQVYFFAAYQKACEDLPALSKNSDTMYRNYMKLQKSGLIIVKNFAGKVYITLTQKAKTWNFIEKSDRSENNPSVLSSKSESPSDSAPNDLGFLSEHIDSYSIESYNDRKIFNSFSSLKENKESMLDITGAREEKISEDVEDDPFDQTTIKILTESNDYIPHGIEPSPEKKTFVKPLKIVFPPFLPHAPAGIKNKFEEYAENGIIPSFEYEYFQYIAWREIKSDKGERPWDPSVITKEFLNETCPTKNKPVKKYIGVKAMKGNAVVKKEYHYVMLFNYDYLASPQVGPQYIKPIMDRATEYCEEYYAILKELYESKLAKQNQRKDDAYEKYLGGE